ncbi:leucine-rich repeat protein [Butyrivibrio sp. VCD2006]|uniref:leucine-rich repeat protein n=1 Tax=Butyrivibrio sp. VCD2006 TaxID=1280664 RepID=UPI0004197D2D|nr:leucine-rich repeat protein [Butyrivibrio sp. VCD2006]
MKKLILALFAASGIAAAFNMYSIKASAERLYPSGEEISYNKLKVGDVFYEDVEDSEPLIYRVVKTATKKKPGIEIEVAGINQNYDWSQKNPKYFDRNNISINIDYESMEEYAPYTIIGIADNAFKDDKTICGFDTSLTHIRYVGKSAFEGCTNLRRFDSYKYLTTFRDRAFYGCEQLNKFYLNSNTLKKIGSDALNNTSSIIRVDTYGMSTKEASKINKLFKKAGAKKVYFSMDDPKKENKKTKIPDESDAMIKLSKGETFTAGEFSYRVVKPATKKHRGEVEITGFSPSATTFELEHIDPWPYVDHIGYERYDIVGVAANAFKDNQTITYAMFADCNIRYIGKSAFEGCSQLKDVSFARTKELKSIKEKAFYGCTSLNNIWIEANKLNHIGKEAFGNIQQKAKVTIQNMSDKQFSKLKQLIKKAGVKKAKFQRKTK